jgi:hypothetical protein
MLSQNSGNSESPSDIFRSKPETLVPRSLSLQLSLGQFTARSMMSLSTFPMRKSIA